MKDFFRLLFIEPFEDGEVGGYLLGFLMWFIGITISVFVFIFMFWLVDSSFMPLKTKNGIVKETLYRPAHYTTTYTQVGRVSVPNQTYHAESYYVLVEIDNLNDTFQVSNDFYNSVHKGEILHCKYTNGRLANSLYIKSLTKLKESW